MERFFGTAQDRLVKGLRKVGAGTWSKPIAIFSRCIPAVEPALQLRRRQAGDAHRALDRSLELASVLSQVEVRTVAEDYTVRWDGLTYQIPVS